MARRFAYVCAGILMLALAFQLGASNAHGAAPGVNFVMSWEGQPVAIFPNGDVYGCNFPGGPGGWVLRSNVFGGNPGGRTIVDADERLALASDGTV